MGKAVWEDLCSFQPSTEAGKESTVPRTGEKSFLTMGLACAKSQKLGALEKRSEGQCGRREEASRECVELCARSIRGVKAVI